MKFKIILLLALGWVINISAQSQYVWNPSSDGLGSGKSPENMVVLPNGDVLIYMDTYPGSPVAPDIYKSTDEGKTWAALNASGLSNINDVVSIKSTSNGLFLIALDSDFESLLYKSVDGGNSWSFSANGISNNHTVFDIVEISSDHWLATASTNNWDHKMYKSTNQGGYWAEIQTSGNDSILGVFGMYYFDNKLYISAIKRNRNHNGLSVFESDDNGLSWNFKFDMPNIWLVKSIIETPDSELFMVGEFVNINSQPSSVGVFRSSDYGASWDTISTTGLEERRYVSGIALTGGTLLLSGSAQQNGMVNTYMFSSPLVPVGIKEELSPNISVYPNPFTDQLFIENPGNKEVVITSITGQILFTGSGGEIDTSSFPQGVYIVSVGMRSQKLVKS